MLARTIATLTTVTALGLAAGCRPHLDPTDPEDRARITRWVAEAREEGLDDVDATDAQQSALEGVEKPVLDEAFRFLEGQAEAKKTLWAEWRAPTVDAARVHAVVDARVDDLRKVLHSATEAAIKVHDTLTAEQRADVAEAHEHRR